ncbi:RING-H2 finger protein ATL7-like [Canna indica]|uniref:RING-H2 finger protein ATL7-like n=1 Tax=Canna indica TaxID=4628 RepID=A0AAQ3KL10_9LILI|nr:RING-H2 finger protein ATL7-like [Canna indica]
MLGSGLNLVTTVIGFGMSATFIVFVCTRLLCGRIRSSDSRGTPFDLELRSDVDQSEDIISGLEPVLVAAIPTMKYRHEAFSSREDAQCSICLGEYEEKEVLRIIPNCNHNFHLACIDVWLQKQTTCPICRLPLNESLESKYVASSSPEVRTGVTGVSHEASGNQYNYNQLLLPSVQRPESIENSQEIHESESVIIQVPHATEQLGHRRGN